MDGARAEVRRVANDGRTDPAHLRLLDRQTHRTGSGYGTDSVVRVDQREGGALLHDLEGGGDVDEPLGERTLPESLRILEPLRDQLTIVQGLSGRMCTIGHSSFYGALGAYKATAEAPPAAATIDGHLSRRFPSVFDHVGLKMGNGSQGTTYPSISAAGRGKQLPFQCNPELAYRNLFGSIAAGGDIQRMYRRTGNVLDAMVADIKKLRRELPGGEQEKLDAYLEGFESLRDRRIELIAMQF